MNRSSQVHFLRHLILQSTVYALAPDGRRTGVVETTLNPLGTLNTNHISYTYDSLNRLTQESVTNETTGDYTTDYTYDLVGNRLSRTVNANGQILQTTYTYNNNDQLLAESNSTTIASIPVRYHYNGYAGIYWSLRPPKWNYFTFSCPYPSFSS
ncbi:MAG: hypothetical protein GKR87_08030 [Kiritimatiellae bacterium]|nr:hypothetical protein [Kiritimatiellia bacterium]